MSSGFERVVRLVSETEPGRRMYCEHKKHDGSLPLIGVNTFLPKDHGGRSRD